MEQEIDFVITWVDGNDENWNRERQQYKLLNGDINIDDSSARYRDWEFLKYWFRSVEVNAPWVRKIHFITYGHLPDFLDVDHPKINIVKHSDYIPECYLPTFSSHPIELNMHHIRDLAEHFVYFNDDMFLNDKVKKEDFFKRGMPCYEALEAQIHTTDSENIYWHIMLNNIAVINKNFKKREVQKKYIWKWFHPVYGKDVFRNICLLPWNRFQNIVNRHLPFPILKSTIAEIWEEEYSIMDKTSRNRFRAVTDVNPYLFRYWDIMKGNFVPCRNKGRAYHLSSSGINEAAKDLLIGKSKMICLNDASAIKDFENMKREINQAFEQRYPQKSHFEIP